MLTYHRAHELLRYDPETGFFWWKFIKINTECRASRARYKAFNSHIAGKRAFVTHKSGDPKEYLRGQIDGKTYRAHRVAWLLHYGRWPKEIDHINGNKSDNRILNLRECTRAENMANFAHVLKSRPLSSGVCWNKKDRTWRVTCGKKYIGSSKSYDEALLIRFEAVHGPVKDKAKMLSIISGYIK